MTRFFEANKRELTWALYLILALAFILWIAPIIGEKRPSRLVQETITGILVGGVYALVALGIVVINKSSGVFNFAHGWMMLVGGMIFFSFFTVAEISLLAAFLLALFAVALALSTSASEADTPKLAYKGLLSIPQMILTFIFLIPIQAHNVLRTTRNRLLAAGAILLLTLAMTIGGGDWRWLHAVVGGTLGAVLLGLVVERFTIRPLIGQPLFTMVLMTLAVGELLHGFTQITWGSVEQTLPIFINLNAIGIPSPIRFDSSATFGEAFGGPIIVRTELVVAFVLALVAFAAFWLFFRYTSIGLAMRATSENQQLAQSLGLRVRMILAIAWAVAALLAGTAGVLQGGATTLGLNMPLLALRAFPAVLLGGLESIGGALVGGLVIGLVEKWGILLFPNQVGTELAPYLVLMIVLIIRPDGLFGLKRIERV